MASSDFADHVSDTDSTPSTDTSEHDFEDHIEKAVSSLVDVFPDTDLNFSRDDAVKYDGKQNKMLYWIQDIFDKDLARFFPTRKEQTSKETIYRPEPYYARLLSGKKPMSKNETVVSCRDRIKE